MKREKKLMILSGVLVVCVIGTVAISKIDFEEKMTGTETTIVDVESSEIVYLAWDYDGEVAFTCEDGTWSYENDEKMSVDQELLNEIAENLSSIVSDKKVEEVQSLGVYGLSDPDYHITIKTSDTTYEISIGDETFSDGEVYISNGDDYVYLTDSGLISDISYSLLDCVQKEEIPEMEEILELTVKNDETTDIIYKENSGYCYSDAYTYYVKDGDSYQNLDNENTEELCADLSEFSWEECVDYYAEDSELASYGLEKPAASVSIVYIPAEEEESEEQEQTDSSGEDKEEEEQTFEYEVGTADGAWYAKLKDSNMVYSISEEVYQAAVNTSYEELKPDEILLLDWDTVDQIEVEYDGSVYTVDLEKNDEDEYVFRIGGTETEFLDVLNELSEITVAEEDDTSEEESEETGKLPEGEPELSNNKAEISLTFRRNTEDYQTVELTFYQYDGSYCIAVLNGEEMNYVERSQVVSFKEAVNSVILDI